ncbi:Protein PROLINE CONTENT ALTERNATIVE 22 [Cardamine amara subsp. amara]|uniref:Protein PROLINE CONTENT ALTERNATIVE 22 n=1 Tax=Cardamine amara subsp. amara TaxID=228776 RepID=A0ABD1AKL5_CARAN
MKEDERLCSLSSSSSSLPVSYGVDCEKYDFSSSVSSLSQPFSPEGSSNKSCVLENNLSSVFSLDHSNNTNLMFLRDRPCSCLHYVFEWILRRCCGCFC